jgi:hypothetical protein
VSNYLTFLGKLFHNHAAHKRTFDRLTQDFRHCQGHEIVSEETWPVEWQAQIHLAPFISPYIGTYRSVHELFTLQDWRALKKPARLGLASP